jgi:alpha-L-fucosidase
MSLASLTALALTVLALRLGASGAAAAAAAAAPHRYEPNWDSLMTRPLPSWYDEAKVGIFIHWGVYSVPSFNIHNMSKAIKDGYAAEWYWWYLHGLPTEEVIAFHNKTYGRDFTYEEFGPMFKAEMWEPEQWAELFQASGAEYVGLTAKHHEGWCNWCSAEAFGWNSCDNGPHRDLVGEMTDAVRAKGLHMGLYHSIFEWYHPLYLEDKANGMRYS